MDTDAERKKLEDEKAFIVSWREHPITSEVVRDNKEQQEALVELICNCTPDNIASLVGHFVAIGELRGLRRSQGEVQDSLRNIEAQLKELNSNAAK